MPDEMMRSNFGRLACLGSMLAFSSAPGVAQMVAAFDPPTQVIELPSSTEPPSGDAVTCSFYPDLMIRISGTDTPAPDDARILREPEKTVPENCDRNPPQGIELQSAGSNFSGRLGNFLLFQLSDPTGASNFTVFDAQDGHKIFTDGQVEITAATFANGLLTLHYVRGINGSCSLLSDRFGCWAELLAGGQIPRNTFAGPPPREACRQTYDAAHSPADNPSIISYEAVLTVDSTGVKSVRPTGVLQCNPMP